MTEGSDHSRREPRYAVSIEVHLHDGQHRVVTQTREVSRRGFFAFLDPAPRVGSELSAQIHPRDDNPISLLGRVRYVLPDIGAGIELAGVGEELDRYQAMVGRLALSTEAWRLIGRFVGDEEGHVPAQDRALIGVGRNLLAVRLLFEKHAPVPIERALGSGQSRADLPAHAHLVGVSAEPVELKLHENDRLRKVWLAVSRQGPSYVALVPPQGPGRQWVLYALSGKEQIALAAPGMMLFPQFTPEEIHAIERDASLLENDRLPKLFNVAEPPRVPKTPTGELPAFPREQLPAPSLAGWTAYTSRTESELLRLFDALGAETRSYKVAGSEREVRLLRDLAFLVRKQGSAESPQPGTLVHDGRRLCVIFGLRSEDSKAMRPLEETDEIRLPTIDG